MRKLLQGRWPGLHSDVVRQALRAIPADVAVSLPDEQLDALVLGIARAMNDVADLVRESR